MITVKQLLKAIENNDTNTVKQYIREGGTINTRDKDGWTALEFASLEGHLEVVKYIIESGADINTKDETGWTALIRASANGNLEVVEYLVGAGADTNTKDDWGYTALQIALRNEHLDVVEVLKDPILHILNNKLGTENENNVIQNSDIL